MTDHRERFDDLLPGVRVGVDMDGVLADFNTGWMSRYNVEFGANLDASMVQEWNGLHTLSLIHISEPTRRNQSSRMPSSA